MEGEGAWVTRSSTSSSTQWGRKLQPASTVDCSTRWHITDECGIALRKRVAACGGQNLCPLDVEKKFTGSKLSWTTAIIVLHLLYIPANVSIVQELDYIVHFTRKESPMD